MTDRLGDGPMEILANLLLTLLAVWVWTLIEYIATLLRMPYFYYHCAATRPEPFVEYFVYPGSGVSGFYACSWAGASTVLWAMTIAAIYAQKRRRYMKTDAYRQEQLKREQERLDQEALKQMRQNRENISKTAEELRKESDRMRDEVHRKRSKR